MVLWRFLAGAYVLDNSSGLHESSHATKHVIKWSSVSSAQELREVFSLVEGMLCWGGHGLLVSCCDSLPFTGPELR